MFVKVVLSMCLLINNDILGHVSRRRSHLLHDQEPAKTDHKDICTANAICVPYVQCPAHVRTDGKRTCKTIIGRGGVCCSTGQNHTGPLDEKIRHHHHRKLDPLTMGLIARHSHAEIAELKLKESVLLAEGHVAVLLPGSASYGHFRNFRLLNKEDLLEVSDLASRAMEIAMATRDFKDRQGLSNQQIELGLLGEDLRLTPLGTICPLKPICSVLPERYRTIDGTCNNLVNTAWGAGMTPYSRLLPPNYHDGIWVPRLSVVNNQPLTSPRKISTTIFSDKDVYDVDHTLMVMQFGQFLSHDVTQSIETSYANGSAISCCSPDGQHQLDRDDMHYACMPIDIPQDDHFYGHFNQRCMNFVRSVLAPRQDCTLGYAQQMNKITHFLDASSVYGSIPEQTGELRSFKKGMLRVFRDFGRPLLPLSKDPDSCLTMERGTGCFMSGDTRTNQMISLVVLHTIFVREHNRIAEILSQLNPFWDDERIFLETRRIVIAELQVIVYKEFLPVVIGDIAMEEFQLTLSKEDYALDYDDTVEPSITNEFASAVWRFGHSTVDGVLKISGKDRVDEMISIPEVMFQPGRMRKALFLDELLSTLTTEPMQEVDNNVVEGLTRYMFRAGNPFGVDLASLNIQRGRDHGLRPYNDYRELVGLPRIKDFDEFGPEMSKKLREVYASTDDIDLWVGGLLEEKAPGSVVGYTFRDIIADQFYRLKKGDRYFFENDPSVNPGYFTPQQLLELRKASMSRLVCDNSDGILLARQAPNAFRKPGVRGNEYVECSDIDTIPVINLLYWQE